MAKFDKTSAETVNEEVFDIQRAAHYLGVAGCTMKQILLSGEVQYRKIGLRYLIPKKALDAWLNGDK